MILSKDKIRYLIQEVRDLEKIGKDSFFQYCVQQRLDDSLKNYQDLLCYENKSLLYKCKKERKQSIYSAYNTNP